MSAPPVSRQSVLAAFGRRALSYDAHAHVQWQSADHLAAYIGANSRDLIDGPLLEVGCGTGVLSSRLAQLFSDRQLVFTDACPEMLSCCRQRLADAPGERLSFKRLAVSDIDERERYAALMAAFVLQWLADLPCGLTRLSDALQPGGRLFFSVPENGSFPEWKALCKQAAVRFTGNTLPAIADLRNFAAESGMHLAAYQETFTVDHPSFRDFLGNMKLIGAATALSAEQLTVTEMRRLLATARRCHGHSFAVTYKVLFGHLEKPS